MKQHTVCLLCKERVVGCHATCERYIEEGKQIAEERERIRKMKLGDALFHEYKVSLQPKIHRAVKSKRGK